MNYGFIYCLGNQCMPGVYKIGMTTRAPSARVDELSASTGVPVEFDLICYGEVSDPQQVERQIHDQFYLERVNESREFFRGDIQAFAKAIEEWCSSFTITNQGGYLLSLNDYKNRLMHAFDNEERVALFADLVRMDCGIAMWRDGGLVRFSCPIELIPHWVILAASASKAVLLQHLPTECPIKPKRHLVEVSKA